MMYKATRIIKESLPILTILMLIEISGGQMLNSKLSLLLSVPTLLLILPLINALAGNIGSVLGSRICSGMHTGTISTKGENLGKELVGALLLGMAVFSFFGAIFLFINTKIALLILVSGLTLTCVVIVLSTSTAIISFRKGMDPDQFVIPIVTTVGDLVGVICIVSFFEVI